MADIIAPGLVFDERLPEPGKDPLLNAGSLLLLDPTHPLADWPVGVPLPGDVIPNIAWEQAKTIVGSGTETTLAAGVSSSFVQGVGTGKDGIIERTSRGALHFLPSHLYDVAGHLYSINLPEPVRLWLNANPAAPVYLGASIRITRAGGAAALQNILRLAQNGSTVRQSIAELSNAVVSGNPTSGSTFVGRTFIPSPGAGVVAVATQGAAVTTIVAGLTYAGAASSTYLHKAPAWILEDVYIEIPSLSNRTYAQILAAHQARYALQHNPGGRLYGDTWTNPTAVP